MRRAVSLLARRYFPPKAVSERLVPWVQLVVGGVAGIWALVQYSTSVADRRADETMKLLSAYATEPKEGRSLKASFDKLWEESLKAAMDDPKAASSGDQSDKTEAQKAVIRNQILERLKNFAIPHYDEYSRIYFYMSTVVVCAAENRCDRAIVNSVIGTDLFSFLNGACGFFAVYDSRWKSRLTGNDIYDYVVSQGLEKKSEARGTSPFFCEKFRVEYQKRGLDGWWTRITG